MFSIVPKFSWLFQHFTLIRTHPTHALSLSYNMSLTYIGRKYDAERSGCINHFYRVVFMSLTSDWLLSGNPQWQSTVFSLMKRKRLSTGIKVPNVFFFFETRVNMISNQKYWCDPVYFFANIKPCNMRNIVGTLLSAILGF